MKNKLASIIFCAVLINAQAAYSHGENGHIKEPTITAKEAEIHDSFYFNHDDEDSVSNHLELEYGFNEWLKGELSLNTEDEENDSTDWISGIGLALQFGLLNEGEYIPETALYIEYGINEDRGRNGPDEIGVKGLFGKQNGHFANVLNLGLSAETGNDNEGGLGFNIGARSAYEFDHHTALGLEYFGNFGQIDDMEHFRHQGHQLGPVVLFEPIEHTHASIGYLFGLSDHAPDGSLKLEFAVHF